VVRWLRGGSDRGRPHRRGRQKLTLSKLRYKLFWLPGELTCPQNRPTLRLANSPALKDWTEEILQRAHKLEPLNI